MHSTDKPLPNMSVIMPAYNEEPCVERAIITTMETFRASGLDFEIIAVNDHSSDRTGEIIDGIASRHSMVRALHHERNRGIGAAFRTGVFASKKDYIILVPVDNPLAIGDLQEYLPRVPVCDIVVGVRIAREGYTPLARLASFTYNRLLVPLFFNIGVSDVNWIQIYRRHLFTDGSISLEHDGIFFLVSILVQARRNRLIVTEVSARMQKRFHGKPSSFRLPVVWRTFWDMICYLRQHVKLEKRQ